MNTNIFCALLLQTCIVRVVSGLCAALELETSCQNLFNLQKGAQGNLVLMSCTSTSNVTFVYMYTTAYKMCTLYMQDDTCIAYSGTVHVMNIYEHGGQVQTESATHVSHAVVQA